MKFNIKELRKIQHLWRHNGVSREVLIERISRTPLRVHLPEIFWYEPEFELMLLEILSIDAGEWEKYLSPEAQIRLYRQYK